MAEPNNYKLIISKRLGFRRVESMNEMIACCGLICTKCEAFLATKNNDDSKKRKIAASWSRYFGMKFEPEDIDCDGCLPENGRRSGYCRKVCEVRPCAHAKTSKTAPTAKIIHVKSLRGSLL